MTRGINNCIDLYPWDYWQVIAAKLTNLNSYNQKEQLFIRMITSNTFEDKMDSQARILLPQKLLTYSKIEKEVLIIGSLKKIELWSPQVFEEYENSFPETFEQIAEEVMRG
jgi:MraZ protein